MFWRLVLRNYKKVTKVLILRRHGLKSGCRTNRAIFLSVRVLIQCVFIYEFVWWQD
jgi:hypothetical protein